MAFVPLLQINQNNGSPSDFTITDVSTGSDPAITDRRIYVYISNNTTLVPAGTITAYTDWPIVDGPLTLDVLTRDFAVMIVGQWLVGSTVTYTYTNYYSFTAYTRTFLYNLSETQSTNPAIIQATNYILNKAAMWDCVFDSDNAVNYGDIQTAQLALDICYYYMTNSTKFF